MYEFIFPLKLANYIARVLDLPGLFVGTYRDTRIEYIHLTNATSQWGAKQNQCLVLKTHEGLYGMEIFAGGDISPFVRLPDKDPLFDLLKKYRDFPDGDGGKQSRLLSRILFPGGLITHDIKSPRNAGDPSAQLAAEYEGMLMTIEQQVRKRRNHLSKKTSLKALPGNDTSNYIYRYRSLNDFGQSSLFGQPDAPHDTEYMLQLRFYGRTERSDYLFVKTPRFFRGMVHDLSGYRRDKDVILDLIEPDVDWIQLIQASYSVRSRTRNAVEISVLLSTQHHDFVTLFMPADEQYAVPELWHVLKMLIAQFPE